jgi:hypothetical protein
MTFSIGVCVASELCAFAWRVGGLRAVFFENLVAFTLIVAAIGADLLDLSRRVLKQIRQGFGIADIVRAGHDTNDFERRFIRAEMEFAPGPAFPDTVLADFPSIWVGLIYTLATMSVISSCCSLSPTNFLTSSSINDFSLSTGSSECRQTTVFNRSIPYSSSRTLRASVMPSV